MQCNFCSLSRIVKGKVIPSCKYLCPHNKTSRIMTARIARAAAKFLGIDLEHNTGELEDLCTNCEERDWCMPSNLCPKKDGETERVTTKRYVPIRRQWRFNKQENSTEKSKE